MRAREFYLIETQVSGASNVSIPKYVANIIEMMKVARADPEVVMELQLSTTTPGAGDIMHFLPKEGEWQELQNTWDEINTAVERNEPGRKLNEIWRKEITVEIVGDLDTYKWPVEKSRNFNTTFGKIYKSKAVKGSSKSWNLGNLTEGIFAGGLYLKLLKETPIKSGQLKNFLLRTDLQNRKPFPSGPGDKINYQSGEQQDRISLLIHLSENNFQALKDKSTLDGLSAHINSVAANVNQSSDLIKLRETLRINNVIDKINVKAEGPVDEKLSTVDVDIHVTNTETNEQDMVHYERSVKAGAVKQFGQVSAGGAMKYKVAGVTAKMLKPVGGAYTEEGMQMIAEKRWALQEEFWKSWSSDINLSRAKKDFINTWMESLRNNDENMRYLDAYTISYDKAAKQLNALLKGGVKKDKKAVKKWLTKFFGELHTHAGKTGRPGAPPPMAKTTHFDKGKYEELDFGELNKYIKVADLEATVSEYKIHSDAAKKRGEEAKERARPEIHIQAKNASPKNSKVKWSKGEVLLIFRFYVAEGKLSNLIEKGPLLRKWAWVASSNKDGRPTDAMGELIRDNNPEVVPA
jgi:hypothetical protein